MIKSNDLLKQFNLHNGPKRYRAFDIGMRSCEVLNENSREFEELMLSLYLLDKYFPNERNLCFVTTIKDELVEIGNDVEHLYRFLTRRNLTIKFETVDRKEFALQKRLLPMNGQSGNLEAPCLFSGGLDSASGAVTLSKEKCPVTLCHTATNHITLGKTLRLHSISPFRNSPLIVTDMRTAGADFASVGTRGLLFLSNAITLASSFGNDHVIFAENGPLMINPAVTPLATPTKNAHPYLVQSLEKIFNQITNTRMKIIPIFKDMTKAEIVAGLVSKGIIEHTWSCFNVQSQSHMCGLCYACFVRRLSLAAIGYEEPDGTYELDPFRLDRFQLTGTALQDLDILHDTILYLEQILNANRLTENELDHIREGFFVDALNLLQRFSLDMFLGLRNCFAGQGQLGTLGTFAADVLQRISVSSLFQRDAQLKTLIK